MHCLVLRPLPDPSSASVNVAWIGTSRVVGTPSSVALLTAISIIIYQLLVAEYESKPGTYHPVVPFFHPVVLLVLQALLIIRGAFCGRQKSFHHLAHSSLGLLSHIQGGRGLLGEGKESVEAGGHVECGGWWWMVVDERNERVGTKFVALGCRTSTGFVSPLRSPDWGQSVSKAPCGCSAATFPGRTTPLLTSHATFLRVSIPYSSMLTSIRSDL
jgi:hypothetical protein